MGDMMNPYYVDPRQPTSLSMPGMYPQQQADYGFAEPNTPAQSANLSSGAGAGLAASEGVAGNSGALMGGAIGAGLGLLSSIGQQNSYKNKMKALATTQRFSPWTHMQGQQPNEPNALGQLAGLAASGATLGQGLAGGSVVPAAYMNRSSWGPNEY